VVWGAIRGFSLDDGVGTGGVDVCDGFSTWVELKIGTELVGIFSLGIVGLANDLSV
jgi:hypothetical protein